MEKADLGYDTLSNFFGCYLNQDFPEDFGDAEGAVRAYAKEFPPGSVSQAADEAAALASHSSGEDALRETLSRLGLEYSPWSEGWTAENWLQWLATELREGAAV